MDILRSADQLSLGSIKTQASLKKATRRLATGLRINSAADDPSGLAISETETSRIKGLQAGQLSVSNAINALTVAEGALQSVTSLVQRMRTLVVQANSDLNSNNNLQHIQTEIDALRLEINSIEGKTQFNNRPLLDGSLHQAQAQPPRVLEIAAEPVPGGSGLTNKTVVNADGLGNPGPLISSPTLGYNVPGSTIEFSVTGFDPVQNAVSVRTLAYGDDPNWGPQVDNTTWVPVGLGPIPSIQNTGNNNFTAFQFVLANLTAQDVGVSQAFTTFRDTPAVAGQPLQVNSGSGEGTIVQVDIPGVSTTDLGISDFSVTRPSLTDGNGNALGFGNTDMAARDALVRLDNALESVGGTRAQIGAQMVALNSANQNSAIDEVSTQASQSAIADANIGQETSSVARDQILVAVQTNVLQSVESDAKQVAQILNDSITSFRP